jgi:hypothetical protein
VFATVEAAAEIRKATLQRVMQNKDERPLITRSYRFRDLLGVLIGTASDRYAGWIGQIYSEGRYEKGITRRSHKVGDKTFNEETLPVESVAEYFEHFGLLEIDYTFYRLLLKKDGKATQTFHVLKSYRQHMKEGDLLLLKVPQVIIARKLRRGSGFEVGRITRRLKR